MGLVVVLVLGAVHEVDLVIGPELDPAEGRDGGLEAPLVLGAALVVGELDLVAVGVLGVLPVQVVVPPLDEGAQGQPLQGVEVGAGKGLVLPQVVVAQIALARVHPGHGAPEVLTDLEAQPGEGAPGGVQAVAYFAAVGIAQPGVGHGLAPGHGVVEVVGQVAGRALHGHLGGLKGGLDDGRHAPTVGGGALRVDGQGLDDVVGNIQAHGAKVRAVLGVVAALGEGGVGVPQVEAGAAVVAGDADVGAGPQVQGQVGAGDHLIQAAVVAAVDLAVVVHAVEAAGGGEDGVGLDVVGVRLLHVRVAVLEVVLVHIVAVVGEEGGGHQGEAAGVEDLVVARHAREAPAVGDRAVALVHIDVRREAAGEALARGVEDQALAKAHLVAAQDGAPLVLLVGDIELGQGDAVGLAVGLEVAADAGQLHRDVRVVPLAGAVHHLAGLGVKHFADERAVALRLPDGDGAGGVGGVLPGHIAQGVLQQHGGARGVAGAVLGLDAQGHLGAVHIAGLDLVHDGVVHRAPDALEVVKGLLRLLALLGLLGLDGLGRHDVHEGLDLHDGVGADAGDPLEVVEAPEGVGLAPGDDGVSHGPGEAWEVVELFPGGAVQLEGVLEELEQLVLLFFRDVLGEVQLQDVVLVGDIDGHRVLVGQGWPRQQEYAKGQRQRQNAAKLHAKPPRPEDHSGYSRGRGGGPVFSGRVAARTWGRRLGWPWGRGGLGDGGCPLA